MNRNIPNLLTSLRMVIVPFFVWLLFWPPLQYNVCIALALFVIGSFTDFLDGYLARKHNIISDFGKIMDPLADKFLVLSAIAGITFLPPINLPPAIFYIILVREVLISVMREIYKKKNIIIPADKLGKIKTVMQMAGIIISLLIWIIWPNPAAVVLSLIEAWFWTVAIITVVSGMGYIFHRQK